MKGLRRAGASAGLTLLLLAAGCLAPAALDEAHRSTDAARPSVVAVLDTGINPYHEAFAAEPGEDAAAFVREFGVAAEVVALARTGTFEERVAADREFWATVKLGVLYAFERTRIMSYVIHPYRDSPVLDPSGHGTGVAWAVLSGDPTAIVLSVQTDARYCANSGRVDCVIEPVIAENLRWAASQPWIDVVSTSLGLPGSVPIPKSAFRESEAIVEASRAIHASGKLQFAATANDPTVNVGDTFSGPPWVVAVAGSDDRQRGRDAFTAILSDVVSNTTHVVPLQNHTTAWDATGGTSFATPYVAGTVAGALAQVRAALGVGAWAGPDGLAHGASPDGREVHVTSRILRDAINATARYFTAAEWDPLADPPPAGGDVVDLLVYPIQREAPVLVPQQMGWGHVNATLATEIARAILDGDVGVPEEKRFVAPYMLAYQRAREAYWANEP